MAAHARHAAQVLPTVCLLMFLAGIHNYSHITSTTDSTYFDRFGGVYSAFRAPQKASIMSIMGHVWAPDFLFDATHVSIQHPSKNPGYVQVADRGVSNASKNMLISDPAKCRSRDFRRWGRRHGRHPAQLAWLAERASAHSQAGFQSLRLRPSTYKMNGTCKRTTVSSPLTAVLSFLIGRE